jgi:hypothetical protein
MSVKSLSEDQVWMLTSAASAVLAAFLTRAAARTSWTSATGKHPPRNPASPSTSWPEAMAWSLGTGIAVSFARLLAQRAAAKGWQESLGGLPGRLRW